MRAVRVAWWVRVREYGRRGALLLLVLLLFGRLLGKRLLVGALLLLVLLLFGRLLGKRLLVGELRRDLGGLVRVRVRVWVRVRARARSGIRGRARASEAAARACEYTDGGNCIPRAALRALDCPGAVGLRPPEACTPSPRVILESSANSASTAASMSISRSEAWLGLGSRVRVRVNVAVGVRVGG
jgi:hypothetical protein